MCFALAKTPFLKVKSIDVKGPTLLVSTSDIKSILEEKYLGVSVFDLRKKSVSDIIMSNFPVIKNVSYKLVFPNSLVVDVDERRPFSYVKPEFQNSYYILDGDGYVLGLTDSKKNNLSVIELSGSMVFAGNKIEDNNILTTKKFVPKTGVYEMAGGVLFAGLKKEDNNLFTSTEFLSEIKTLGLLVLSTKVNSSGIEITTLSPKIIVIISQSINGQEKEKALLLDKIIQKYNIEGKAVKRIDLRFSNPIVDF